MADPKTDKVDGDCMTPGCGDRATWKGLCRSCYGQARNAINRDNVSWEYLESLGLCKLDDKPWTAAYKAARHKKEEQA